MCVLLLCLDRNPGSRFLSENLRQIFKIQAIFKMRNYNTEEDFWRIRAFLREIFFLNERRERSWHVARLDYWRWHLIENCRVCGPLEEVTFIWETTKGKIYAVLNPFEMGEVVLHIHPDFRSPDLEHELFAAAEKYLTGQKPDGQRYLVTLADQDDPLRQQVLADRGYMNRGQPVRRWRRDLNGVIPAVEIAPGYTIRSMGGLEEHPARSWASWTAFHPHEPAEAYEGWEWYCNVQRAPLYRRDLDIVAAVPSGEIAAFSTIFFDDVTRSGVCVLVGTAAEHQRRGLGKAVITEGLRRLERMGATRAFANGFDPPANALYSAVLGTVDLADSWVKTWT